MSHDKFFNPIQPWLTTALTLLLAVGLFSPHLGQAEVVRIGGTGSGLGTMRALAESFQSKNPEFQFEIVPSLGSSGGIKAVTSRSIQIALSNRALKPDEAAANLRAAEYARTPFVFITSKPGVSELKLREIADIYAGRLSQWPDGGLIRLVLRDVGDTDNTTLAAISPEMKEAVVLSQKRKGLTLALNDQEGADAVVQVSGALSTSTLALVRSEERRVHMLSVEGVAPTVANLQTGRYPYFKPLYLIQPATASVQVTQFLAFVRSSAGQSLMTKMGNLPVIAAR